MERGERRGGRGGWKKAYQAVALYSINHPPLFSFLSNREGVRGGGRGKARWGGGGKKKKGSKWPSKLLELSPIDPLTISLFFLHPRLVRGKCFGEGGEEE